MQALKWIAWWAIIAVLLAGIFIFTQVEPEAECPDSSYKIQGKIADTYNSIKNPVEVFGCPISDESFNPIDNSRVQYFQKARFDLVTTGNESVVRLAPLGTWLYKTGGEVAQLPGGTSPCRYFSDTGKDVCWAFLNYYEKNDGDVLFGDPISDVEIDRGFYVQYFERARMEWHPEMSGSSHVVLTDLGKYYRDSFPTADGPSYAIPSRTIAIEAHAFVNQAVVSANEQQTLFVIVQFDNKQALPKAEVTATVYWPDGTLKVITLPATNNDGMTKVTFPVGSFAVGSTVRIDVQVEYPSSSARTETWFRIWY